MHETSLGETLRDYLTGESIEATTYEDLRQALARLLVEGLGYPSGRVVPRLGVRFPVDDGEYCRTVDLTVTAPDGSPLMLVFFCPGQVNTFARESLAAARLMTGGPAPLVAVSDLRDAALYAVADGTQLASGMRALPRHADIDHLAAAHPVPPMDDARRAAEQRILYAYSEFLKRCCDESVCLL